ncbi:MAG: Crp/Fnr family transcriptional regulator [Myxococcota bacterium]
MKRVELEQTELFSALGRDRLAKLRAHLELRPFAASEYLYFETQSAQALWVVRAGMVRTFKTSAGGHVTTLERLRPGALFGMAAAVGAARYGEGAQAVVAGEAWRVSRRLVGVLLKQEPMLSRALLAIVATRLRSAHDRLCSFAHDNVPARLARAVLEETDGERIELTRRALGESVGTTVETTIRVLRGFQREGWIEGGVGWIRVLDREALQRVADGGSIAR